MGSGNVSAECLILGGGIIGCAAAYELARRGHRVIVLEKEDTACGTVGASGGLISWFTCLPGPQMELFDISDRMYEGLEEELRYNFGLRFGAGNLQLISDEYELETARKLVAERVRDKREAYIIDINEVRELEPEVNKELKGAIYIPHAHYVNPIKMALAYRKAAEDCGARFYNQEEAIGFLKNKGRIIGVRTVRNRYFAERTINCCGVWGGRIAELAGYRLPVTARKGQLLVTEPVSKLCNTAVSSCAWQMMMNHPELVKDKRLLRYSLSFTIEQTETGACILHGTREESAITDVGNEPEVIELIAQTACRYIPRLRDMKIIRAFSGLRPWTPDQLPVIGNFPENPELIMCCGHSGEGIALAPGTAKALVDWMETGGSPDIRMEAFSPLRWKGTLSD